jgi:hypothetical protein
MARQGFFWDGQHVQCHFCSYHLRPDQCRWLVTLPRLHWYFRPNCSLLNIWSLNVPIDQAALDAELRPNDTLRIPPCIQSMCRIRIGIRPLSFGPRSKNRTD